MTGNTITLQTDGAGTPLIINSSNNPHSIQTSLVFSNAGSIAANTGDLTISGAGTVNNGGNTLTLNASSNRTLSVTRPIQGTGGMTKSGLGTAVLSGNNSYGGISTITQGTLSIDIEGRLGSIPASPTPGKLVMNGGTLRFPNSNISREMSANRGISLQSTSTFESPSGATLVLNPAITGTGRLIKTGAGSLVLAGVNSYSGGTTVSAGQLQISSNGNLGNVPGSPAANHITLNGGILQSTATLTLSNNRGITLDPSGTLSTNADTTMTYGGIITGTTLFKDGAGTLILTGNSTLGSTSILNGTLQIGMGGSTGMPSGQFLNSGALVFNHSNLLTTSQAVSGSGVLTKQGTGTLVATGILSHTGGTTVSGGTLRIGNGGTAGSISGNVIISPGATMEFNRSNDFIQAGIISGTGALSGTGSLTMLGSGRLTLSGNNTYSGDTFINAGEIATTANERLPDFSDFNIAPGAALVLDTPNVEEKIGGLGGSGTVAISNSSTLILNPSGNHQFNGTITDSGLTGGSLEIDSANFGTQILGAANTYRGRTWVRRGTLVVAANGALSPTAPLTLSLNARVEFTASHTVIGSIEGGSHFEFVTPGAILDVGGSNANSTLLGNHLLGPGSLEKSGTGALTLSVSQSYSGHTRVRAGSLLCPQGLTNTSGITVDAGGTFSGEGHVPSLDSSGTINPGVGLPAGDALVVDSTCTVRAGSRIAWAISDWTGAPGVGVDLIDAQSLVLQGTPGSPIDIQIYATAGMLNFTESERVFKLIRTTGGISGFNASAFTFSYLANLSNLTGTWSMRHTGNDLELVYTPGGETYETWIAGYFAEGADRAFSADPDMDGIPNGIEFVIGGIPHNSDDSARLPEAQASGGQLIFSYSRHKRSIYLNPYVRHSTTLQAPWFEAIHGEDGVLISINPTDPIDPDLDWVTVSIPMGADAIKFAQLAVTNVE